MNSKTPFCNKTLIRKDLQRFWPVWATLTAVMLTGFTMVTLFRVQQLFSRTGYTAAENLSDAVYSISSCMTNGILMFVIFAIAIITAVSVYGYMNRTCSAYMLHSLPIRRETHCMSHMISGLIMIAGPVTLTWLSLFAINLYCGAGMWQLIAEYYLESLIMVIFYYSLAVFTVLLCGSGILSAIVYTVLNCGVLVAGWLLGCVNSVISYPGLFNTDRYFDSQLTQALTPLLEMFRILKKAHPTLKEQVWNPISGDAMAWSGTALGQMALYLIPAAVLILLSVLLYKKRPFEQTGKLLVFKWSVPIFRFVFVFFAGIIFALLIYLVTGEFMTSRLSYSGVRICFIIFGIIGVVIFYAICDMILQRTFKIWSSISWLQILTIAAIVTLIITGQSDNYKRSLINNTGTVDKIELTDMNSENTFIYEDKADILSISELESEMTVACRSHLKTQTVEEVSSSNNYTITVYYSNGSEQTRRYALSYSLDKELLTQTMNFINDPDRVLRSTTILKLDPDSITSIDVYNYYEYDGYNGYNVTFDTREDTDKFMDALKADIADGNLHITWVMNDEYSEEMLSDESSSDSSDYDDSTSDSSGHDDSTSGSIVGSNDPLAEYEDYGSCGTVYINYEDETSVYGSSSEVMYLNFTPNCTNTIKLINDKCKNVTEEF